MKQHELHFILLANYLPDRQESMARYALNLRDSLHNEQVQAEIWYPTVFFGTFSKNTHAGVGKWLTYLDKYLLFPVQLWLKLKLNRGYAQELTFFHICDHSNSPYLSLLPANRSGITCHDVLAIRGAAGFKDTHCESSATGKILQRWILTHLSRAKILSAVSQFTMKQLLELSKNRQPDNARWRVIPNSFNECFFPMEAAASAVLLANYGIGEGEPFLLTVGSAEPRKNRKLLLDMAHCLTGQWAGLICYAGQPLDPSLLNYAEKLGLRNRVINIVEPDHRALVALYSACTAFVFPSFAEGFGWPLIEAQACGAPVIASSKAPMPEITNGAALYADPYAPADFADAFLKLMEAGQRERLIALGFENCKRFDRGLVVREFIDLYMESSLRM
ncbi:glycosyltransferase family 4 protein [Pedobacter immunditicola]|uniref:glycosyltransferase family 4 protein n=1 Tax=Pedobacter immunditicola TaxID=3133440 RepID=UPI0030B410F1